MKSAVFFIKELLDASLKTYGCESIQVAYAHQAISKARMSMHMMDNEYYYTHALEAVRIARSCLGQKSPRLHTFLHTMGKLMIDCRQNIYTFYNRSR